MYLQILECGRSVKTDLVRSRGEKGILKWPAAVAVIQFVIGTTSKNLRNVN